MVREWFDRDGERWLVRPLRSVENTEKVTKGARGPSLEVMSFLNFGGHFQAPNPGKLDPHKVPDHLLQQMLDQARLELGREHATTDRLES